MSTTVTEAAPAFTTIELRSAYGNMFRTVSTAEPREATADEIPVIDISGIYGDFEARRELAAVVKSASESYGFFYVKNHGIAKEIIERAEKQTRAFFKQPAELKEKVSSSLSKYHNGWTKLGSRRISPTESVDQKEGFSFRYAPQYDPEPKDIARIPAEVQRFLRGEDFVWQGTTHLPDFKNDIIAYWQACLTLARRLIRIFALALELPEDYFDAVTTYPGSDGALNYYPGTQPDATRSATDVGLGSHTDLQCLTLLWQDKVGGRQVLNKDGQWIKASPIDDTFVVNLGDFLMRLSNDRLKSTVHRVYNRTTEDRISMPFFFGFNFNEVLSVLDNCIDEDHPPKYGPISCGEYCQLRFEQGKNAAAHA